MFDIVMSRLNMIDSVCRWCRCWCNRNLFLVASPVAFSNRIRWEARHFHLSLIWLCLPFLVVSLSHQLFNAPNNLAAPSSPPTPPPTPVSAPVSMSSHPPTSSTSIQFPISMVQNRAAFRRSIASSSNRIAQAYQIQEQCFEDLNQNSPCSTISCWRSNACKFWLWFLHLLARKKCVFANIVA